MGPMSMPSDEHDEFSLLPLDFMPSMSQPSAQGSWRPPANTGSPSSWLSPQDGGMSPGRSSMPHANSAPSLGLLHRQAPPSPTMNSPVVPPMDLRANNPSARHSQAMSGGSHWGPAPHHQQQPASRMGNDADMPDYEERLQDIMHQSNAALSMPMPMNMQGMPKESSLGPSTNGMSSSNTMDVRPSPSPDLLPLEHPCHHPDSAVASDGAPSTRYRACAAALRPP